MDFNVDFVFPYLDPSDPNWLETYKYCKSQEFKGDSRFRDFSLLKYIFRSIELYAPWINRVCMIVQSKSQVPDWLKESSYLRIIEHKEFIPEKYLPVFNSNTIEMFLPKIEGLSDHIIYSNDDLIFVNPCTKKDFFTQNGSKTMYAFKRRKAAKSDFLKCCERTFKLVFSKHPMDMGGYEFIKQWHGSAVPLLLKDMQDCYKEFEKDILNSLTMFRNCLLNYNQYMYGNYSYCKGHSLETDIDYIGSYISKENSQTLNKMLYELKTCKSKMICINDTEFMTEDDIKKIRETLEKRFPDKSIYEV